MKKAFPVVSLGAALAGLLASPPASASSSFAHPPVTVQGSPKTGVLSDKGTSDGNTKMFKIPSSAPYWQVDWSYNCHPAHQQGLFDWSVRTPTGDDNNDIQSPNQLGWGYTAAQRYFDHGTFYLSIVADQGCVWSVQVITPSTPTYTVHVDQQWWFLQWTTKARAAVTIPVQLKVTFTNKGPGALTLRDDLSVAAMTAGDAIWTGQPDQTAHLYQCNQDLATELAGGHTIAPGRVLTGCAVFDWPKKLYKQVSPHSDAPVALWTVPGVKPFVMRLLG